jgi:hypothetical protein
MGEPIMSRRCCDRCGSIILGPVQVIELSRRSHRGAELERTVVCSDCADAVRVFLATRPEPIDLDPIPPDPPLQVAMR